jgi:hypothetical protein
MASRVLFAYGSKYGATAEIADGRFSGLGGHHEVGRGHRRRAEEWITHCL